MMPARIAARANWTAPPRTTAARNARYEPSVAIADMTMAVRPAAGPLTISGEALSDPTTTPPTTPEMMPANNGAPEASAIPRHSGTATRNTTSEAGRSVRHQAASGSAVTLSPRSEDLAESVNRCKTASVHVMTASYYARAACGGPSDRSARYPFDAV